MTPERYERLGELYHAALEVEPESRANFLDGACDSDEELRREVEVLLAAHSNVGSFFAAPALRVAAELVAERQNLSLAGQKLSHYRVQSLIGAGGMGEVYLASRADERFEKQVAIKIVQRGMENNFVINRFRQERQILARLEHPNIARLLDGGTTEDGWPYLVMDYVEGKPITQYCDDHTLTTFERLQLFRQVCSAVQYAHKNLVIHRDIKPGNILVKSDGTPKLLDFGLAKLLAPEDASQAEATASVARLMTPAYASPEQARGEPITTASDIYSLGVLLYQLLTGHRPYEVTNSSPLEMVRVICEQEPFRPSTVINRSVTCINEKEQTYSLRTPEHISKVRDVTPEKLRRQLKGDLDNITLKALRKEHERRYSSVEKFADDIRRHLEGLPISARPDTFSYRAGKFIGRHRTGVIAATVVGLLLIAATLVAVWQARVARNEEGKALIALAKVEDEKQRADENAKRALRNLEEANEQRNHAEHQRQIAIKQQALAEQQRRRAELALEQQKLAEKRRVEAERIAEKRRIESELERQRIDGKIAEEKRIQDEQTKAILERTQGMLESLRAGKAAGTDLDQKVEQTRQKAETVTVTVRGTTPWVFKGENLFVSVIVNGDAEVSSAEISLTYDTNLLELKAVRESGLLSTGGQKGEFNHTADGGLLKVQMALPDGAKGVKARGQLLLIIFIVKNQGMTALKLDGTRTFLRSPAGDVIPINVQSWEVEAR